MKITSRQLRQIIREELIREAGFGDVRVAEDRLAAEQEMQTFKALKSLWHSTVDKELVSSPRDTRTPSVYSVPGGLEFIEQHVDYPKFLRELEMLRPKMMADFDNQFRGAENIGLDGPLLDVEIRGEYEAWINWICTRAKEMLSFPMHKGEVATMSTGWRGPERLMTWLSQVNDPRSRGRTQGHAEFVDIKPAFMRGMEPLTGLVFRALSGAL